jgi:hypothetical protein
MSAKQDVLKMLGIESVIMLTWSTLLLMYCGFKLSTSIHTPFYYPPEPTFMGLLTTTLNFPVLIAINAVVTWLALRFNKSTSEFGITLTGYSIVFVMSTEIFYKIGNYMFGM